MKPQHVKEYYEIHSKSKPMNDALTNPHLYGTPFEYMTPNLETLYHYHLNKLKAHNLYKCGAHFNVIRLKGNNKDLSSHLYSPSEFSDGKRELSECII
jgi:hypothetical protein